MDKNQPQGYSQVWVWTACATIYGGAIAPSTWSKYKSICEIPDSRKKENKNKPFCKTHTEWLLMLAWKRREQREKYGGILPRGRGCKIILDDLVKELNKNTQLKKYLDDRLGEIIFSEGILGKDAPAWLNRVVGDSRSLRTLYTWAHQHKLEFCSDKPVPEETLNAFIELV